jgi:hypothetical protein
LITATNDVNTAYLDASGRVNPDFVDLGAGAIGGLTLLPGLYQWTMSVTASGDVVISGLPTDVWIFQIAGSLSIANAKEVILDGALAKNIFWQVADGAVVGSGGHFEGILLSKTTGVLQTGASMNWENFGTNRRYFAASNSQPAVLRTRRCPTYQLLFHFFSGVSIKCLPK